MRKPDIRGLKHYDQVSKIPDQITSEHRRTKYDQVISDAKRKAVRLAFENENSATNVYVALRARMRRDGEALQVRKRGLDVYVFAGMKPARLRSDKMRQGFGGAGIRTR